MNLARYVGRWCNRPEARQLVCPAEGNTSEERATFLLQTMASSGERVLWVPKIHFAGLSDDRIGLGVTESWVYGIYGEGVFRMKREESDQ